MFKIKDGYKVELQAPETIKLFGSIKKSKDKTENGINVPSLEVAEIVLVQCNLVDNQYQQKCEVLYTFTLNNFYANLLNVEPSNLVFLKTFNIELAMRQHSIEPKTRKYVKGHGFLSFARKYRKQLLDAGLDSLKTASKKKCP